MKIKIYTDCPVKLYYQGVYSIEEDIELVGTRFLYYSMIKLNNRFKFLRKLTRRGEIKNEPVSGIWRSFSAPFRLLFCKNIVLPVTACRNIVYYLLLLKLLRKNLIFHSAWPYHGEKYIEEPKLWNKFFWKLFFRNIKAIGNTRKATEGLRSVGARAYYIPHSVETSIFKPKEKDNKKPVVLYVGRLNEAKGIKSILKLADKFNKEAKFVFVGSGPLENEVRNNKNVEFLGEINDRKELAEVYRNSDIFILNSYKTPEWEEIFGRVLIEAMSSGLAVISTDCIGPKEIIRDGENGFLIEQKNDRQLLEKFNILLKDKKLREKMGKNAREDALEKYDIKKISEKWLEVIKK
ncbi:MAG: glycosyltransferase family 4 protein [Nanoarchaeota archaeon]|nr:glycosyltransferase family 4 protein [Nanoarchaeota archaeon]